MITDLTLQQIFTVAMIIFISGFACYRIGRLLGSKDKGIHFDKDLFKND
ncbi:MAG TPA: hypothetical protein VHO03_16490 [Ignavibacteriales bacterium]|nr:hypothetical protein [Ignavibacteriales bacterium]